MENIMENNIKIKRYLDVYIDTETCNFKCHYCYIFLQNKFGKQLFHLKHSPQEIRKALSKERLGGTCVINLCAGGETLLSPDVLPVVKELIDEGHYVMIVTNGSVTKRFEEVRDTFTPEECAHVFFKFSFHYLELLRLNIMDKYFANVKMMHEKGCSFTIELTPNDELLDKIDDIKKCCLDNIGALPHLTIARDDRTGGINHLSEKLDWEAYKKTWGVFDSALFNFKKQIFYVKRKEFCYAGDYSMYINLTTGDWKPCNCGLKCGNIYTDKNLNFKAIGRCQLPHCYNGHFWLAFGNIPNKELSKTINVLTFAEERDRIMTNGEHWLKPSFQSVFNTNASQTNEEYSNVKKTACIFTNFVRRIPYKVYHLIKRKK